MNNDPKLKTKAEKDRRLKEKQAANTKKIIDERKSKGMKENKASWKEEQVHQLFSRLSSQVRTKLQNTHKKELEDLSKWVKVTCEIQLKMLSLMIRDGGSSALYSAYTFDTVPHFPILNCR